MQIQHTLEEYGLTDKQAKVYLACLSLGSASITQISKKAQLKRPTTYLIIDELLEKHFLVVIPHGKKNLYKAEDPEKLLKELNEKRSKFEAIMPELKNIYAKSLKQPRVRFYEGKDKLLKMYEEIFRSKEIWAIFSDEYLELFTEEEKRHMFRLLVRHGGIIYDLVEDTKASRLGIQAKYRKGVSEAKFLPDDMDMATNILVFGDKLAVISLENVVGVIIEDEDIANTQKALLKFIWKHLE